MNSIKRLALTLLTAAATATMAFAQESTLFSASPAKGTPVQISSNRDKGYVIKSNGGPRAAEMPVASGMASYTADEVWYLVGDADGFRLYNHESGDKLALKLGNVSSGAEATMAAAKEATTLVLNKQEDGSFTISPKENPELSFNMFGGAGRDIKLYSSQDNGGYWNIRPIDMSKPLRIKFNAQLEGGFDTNTRIGEIAITVDGTRSNTMLSKEDAIEASVCYLPKGAKFSIATGLVCHGWKMDINGGKEIAQQTLPDKGMEVTVNIDIDKNNRYQYLFYSPDKNGVPYRIPAIVTAANGYVFAINDYRPCGNDIGFGEVDLVMRHSTKGGEDWDGHSWSEPVKIADGLGKDAPEIWQTGFGDPAVVADRERNEILVMSVCGNRVCWNGNYGAGTADNPENPNRMARLRIKFNETTQEWEASKPEEITYEMYPLFKDKDGKAHVGSMFIGAGRMAQSSMIKVGDYYRIYCAVWAVETGSYRHHNYVLYSDDFGDTWNLLGELGKDFSDSPAPYGNEPKCEELPDGSVLLSSRKGYGRYFNVFHYNNFERAEGYWDGAVATDKVEGSFLADKSTDEKFKIQNLKFGSNDTNGEVLRIGHMLFQSVPTGDKRSDVAIFFRELSSDPATYTPTELSRGWKKLRISDRGSAYSSMCILPNGDIGIYYEEEPGGYSMVYVPINVYRLVGPIVYTGNLVDKCPTCKRGKYEGIVTVE